MPLATLQAFNDHGKVAETITQGVAEARAQLRRLAELGIDLEKICAELTEQGLDLFSKALDGLLHAIEARATAQRAAKKSELRESLGKRKDEAQKGLEIAREKKIAQRLWGRDATLWGGGRSVAKDRLGWLDATRFAKEHLGEMASFAREAAEKFSHCVLLGMGGSSLAPQVLEREFGKAKSGLGVRVLDSTAPRETLFLVSSKSGATAEVDAFYRHFRAQIDDGAHFVAITDPGTPLQKLAGETGFWRTFLNPKDIGGRYSALSYFGLVPAALLGLSLDKLIEEAEKVALASQPQVPLTENLAIKLGAIAGGLSKGGADKLTLLFSKRLAPFALWLEQLIAESTGKNGRGIVPVSGEPLGKKDSYGPDRCFVSLSLQGEAHDMGTLAEAGHPLLQWKLADAHELGGEFLRWEIATAAAGAVLEIDPFDEPDVAASKQKTQELLERGLSPQEPSLRSQGLALFASPEHAQILRKAAGTLGAAAAASAPGWIAAHLALGDAGDYVALQAFFAPNDELEAELHAVQGAVRNATRLACAMGFGPRFLHSTGQLHKGGPNTGLFLQLTSSGGEDLPIPGKPYGFGALFAAQARGDFEVLQARGRRVLRIHAEDGKPDKLLQTLHDAVKLISHK